MCRDRGKSRRRRKQAKEKVGSEVRLDLAGK